MDCQRANLFFDGDKILESSLENLTQRVRLPIFETDGKRELLIQD